MAYVGLGSRTLNGAVDRTGNNTGNWTVSFSPDVFNVNVPQFEVYKMIVHGAANSSFTVFVDQKQWDLSIFGDANSWDPQQPLILLPGQTLYFYYSDPTTDNTPPNVTCWLRYDPAVLGLVLWAGNIRISSPGKLSLSALPEACLSTLPRLALTTW